MIELSSNVVVSLIVCDERFYLSIRIRLSLGIKKKRIVVINICCF